MTDRPLTLFVHRASEMLTDHLPHGDGLICFSLLNGLAERGHRIFAYANYVKIDACCPLLQTRSERRRIPANSLVCWEHGRRAERWLRHLTGSEQIDIVWRMHPYFGVGYPLPHRLQGKPLVIGPLFDNWPQGTNSASSRARARFGISLKTLMTPVEKRGWQRALSSASILISSNTAPEVAALRARYSQAEILSLPLIVEPPQALMMRPRDAFAGTRPLQLVFVANLLPYKNPLLFCEIVKRLRDMGIGVEGTLLGDGPERPGLEEYCRANRLQDVVRFAGKVPNAEVFPRLCEADLLISLSMGEPYGRSIVEAMSVGTPCICHRSGGPADYIMGDIDGILVEQLSVQDYADAIASMERDPSLWSKLSANAMARAAEWTREAVLSRLELRLMELRRNNANR